MMRIALALAAMAALVRADLAREVEAVCAATGDVPRASSPLLCAAGEGEEGEGWAFDLTGYFTDPPDDDPYGSAILRADRGALHVEGRYNYEDKDTGSLWAGWTLSWSGEVEFSLVPMAGVVFGHTQGVAPGLELDVVWRALELYVEAEYVFDTDGKGDSFFYMWSELTVSPTEWLKVGLVAQRTRAYDTDVGVDRGLLVGFHVRAVTATVYVFNLDQDDPYVMIGIGLSF
ncbi:MAG TPA: hypothetical protein VFX78_12035 [Candidatus Eisenbacteria bacterium]|nr:hypothetical protein [Candidatus Eisenbacteria bacterium]